ncbi:MAG: histidine triad nucleotide-binding protein [Minisyncoccales bacterium]
MKNCIFCKIIQKVLPAKIVFENKKFIAFYDINPKAPWHILILPKKHIPSLQDIRRTDGEMTKEIFFVVQRVAKKLKLDKKGYKIGINVGQKAGQLISHFHLHLLSGWQKKSQMENQRFP